MEKQPQPIQVELGENAAEGIYSNLVLTAHTNAEFILDFARMLPGLKKAKILSRIIMTPQSAKSLLKVLERTVAKFEETFGKIEIPPQQGGKQGAAGIGFQTSIPEAEPNKPEES